MVNDAPSYSPDCNTVMKMVSMTGVPRLCLFARRLIKANEELMYDYGDSKNLWWRQKVSIIFTSALTFRFFKYLNELPVKGGSCTVYYKENLSHTIYDSATVYIVQI